MRTVKSKKIFKFILFSLFGGGIFGLLVTLIGCASIMHGTRQDLSVNSMPSGAKVFVRGVHMVTTPSVVELKRKDSDIVLRFEKDGYEPVEVALHRTMDGWVWGNVLFGGFVGLAVDFINGAAYKLTPAEVNAVLERTKLSMKDLPKDGLLVAVDMQELKEKHIR